MTNLMELSIEELTNLAENDTSEYRYARYDIFKALFEKYQECGDTDKMEEMRKEVLIFNLSTHGYPPVRFSPLMTGRSEEGQEVKFPDLERDFPKESLEYYKKRTSVANNPINKARYSDVIWELDKDVEFARLAVDAYLDCCPAYLDNGWDSELADSLHRALSIAIMINDGVLITKALEEHYQVIGILQERRTYRYLIEIIRSILRLERRTDINIDYDELITFIEESISYYFENEPDSFHLQRSFLTLEEEIWKIRRDEDSRKKIRVRVAESFVEEAEWKRKHYPKGNMVAATIFQNAMQEYVDLGGYPERVEELKIKIKEANEAAAESEYSQISTEVEIPRREIEEYIEEVYKGISTIDVFCLMSGDKNLLPSYEEAREVAIKHSKEFVFQHLVPLSLIRGNIKVKEISEEEEKLEYGAINNLILNYKLIANTLLNSIFELLEKEHSNYINELERYLSESQIIDKERLELINRGLTAYKNEDYVASNHILVFQIEGIVRDLLGKTGLPTFIYRSGEMRERMMNDVLSALFQTEGIDKDLIKFMEVFLCDIRGENYRNDIAHGLVKLEGFTKERAQQLLLILIKLAAYAVIQREKIN